MKKASRFMPKYTQSPTNIGVWVIVTIFMLPLIWLFCSSPALLVIIPFIVLFLYFEHKRRKEHFRDLILARKNYSICDFARYFDCKKIDTWVVRAVYEQLQDYLKSEHEKFPVLPEDDIFNDLQIDDEDFAFDIVEEIALRTGRTLNDLEGNPYYGKVNIVKNLVYFFNEQPMVNTSKAN